MDSFTLMPSLAAFAKSTRSRYCGKFGLKEVFAELIYSDRSFSFVTKTPPAAVLIKKACNLKSGSGVPNKTKVAKITKAQVKEIAELKMPDLNAASVETAMSMIEGTCRSMGVTVVED